MCQSCNNSSNPAAIIRTKCLKNCHLDYWAGSDPDLVKKIRRAKKESYNHRKLMGYILQVQPKLIKLIYLVGEAFVLRIRKKRVIYQKKSSIEKY